MNEDVDVVIFIGSAISCLVVMLAWAAWDSKTVQEIRNKKNKIRKLEQEEADECNQAWRCSYGRYKFESETKKRI